MEPFFDWVERSFIPWAGRFSGNKYMTVMLDTFYRLIPFWIVLSFFQILQWGLLDPEGPVMGENGLALGHFAMGGLYGEEYQATAFYQLSHLFSASIDSCQMLFLFFLAMTLATQLTKIWGGDKSLAAFCALGGFFMFTQMEASPVGSGVAAVFGHPPLRVPSAILFAVMSARMLSWLERVPILHWRVPPYLPERVVQPLTLCITAGLTLMFFLFLGMAVTGIFSAFSAEMEEFILSGLRPAAQTLPFALLYQAAMWLLWWLGLFGEAFLEIIRDSAYLPAQLANQASAAAAFSGEHEAGFVFTSGFFLSTGVHVLALAAAVLVFSGNRRWRHITAFMLPMLVFNVMGPFLFCLPVVLNPAFLLPFIVAPLANTVVAWAAVSWGIVPLFKFAAAHTVPPLLQGVLGTGSLMGGVLQLVMFILDVFIYAPFVIVANRLDGAQEGEGGDAP